MTEPTFKDWKENNLCGVCPYRKDLQDKREELLTELEDLQTENALLLVEVDRLQREVLMLLTKP